MILSFAISRHQTMVERIALPLSILCFIGCVFTFVDQSALAKQPNILLILADDVGSEVIGCYGGQSYPTPNIDRLAGQGLKFNHGYSMPVCHPTRICLMTGKYPFRFGAAGSKWGSFPKQAESTTIAHTLKRAGYATAVAGKWQLCLMKDDVQQPRRLGFDEWCLFGWHEGGRYHDPLLYRNGKILQDTEGKFGPDIYVDFLSQFMKRNHESGRPFFAYYPMALCHAVTDDLKNEFAPFYKDERWMTYGEMVSAMDDMVGRLVKTLDDLNIRKETLIIFVADNGTTKRCFLYVNEKGKMIQPPVVSVRNGEVVPGGKGELKDVGTRVPLIASWPGKIAPGSTTEAMVDFTDFLPTFAQIGSATLPDQTLDGHSFAKVLGTPTANGAREWIFTEHRNKRCVRSKDFRFYDNGKLFNVSTDPNEQSPLDPNSTESIATSIRGKLQSVLDSHR